MGQKNSKELLKTKQSFVCGVCSAKVVGIGNLKAYYMLDLNSTSFTVTEFRILCASCHKVSTLDFLLSLATNSIVSQNLEAESKISKLTCHFLKLNEIDLKHTTAFQEALSVCFALRSQYKGVMWTLNPSCSNAKMSKLVDEAVNSTIICNPVAIKTNIKSTLTSKNSLKSKGDLSAKTTSKDGHKRKIEGKEGPVAKLPKKRKVKKV
eukprot:Platyproteum_vivax@DN2972_c0_g1_i1.p1